MASNLVVMAGRSGYVIELGVDERAELERRVACYTLPHKVVVRAKMILYAAEGQPTAEIARRLETAPRVVARWRKRFFEERIGFKNSFVRGLVTVGFLVESAEGGSLALVVCVCGRARSAVARGPLRALERVE